MILLDFRNWEFVIRDTYLPETQKKLLQIEFDSLKEIEPIEVLKVPLKVSVSDLFFKNKNYVAVSSVKNIELFYEVLDLVLELENKELIDYTEAANEGVYFYGSNSLVVHLEKEIALCGINKYTDESIFEEYCEDFELTPLSFELSENYLTADIAFFIKDVLLVCIDMICDKKVKKQILNTLKKSNLKLIFLTKHQVEKGVLNMKNCNGVLYLTEKSKRILERSQLGLLEEYKVPLKTINLPFLESADVKLRDIIL